MAPETQEELELFGPDAAATAASAEAAAAAGTESDGKGESDDSTFKEGEEEEPLADDATVVPDVD